MTEKFPWPSNARLIWNATCIEYTRNSLRRFGLLLNQRSLFLALYEVSSRKRKSTRIIIFDVSMLRRIWARDARCRSSMLCLHFSWSIIWDYTFSSAAGCQAFRVCLIEWTRICSAIIPIRHRAKQFLLTVKKAPSQLQFRNELATSC